MIICWSLKVFVLSHHTPGRHSQHSGEWETQRIALRQHRNCGILIHLLLLFRVCLLSITGSLLYNPCCRGNFSFGWGQLSASLPSPQEVWGVLMECSPLPLQSYGTPRSHLGLLFEPTFPSIHLGSNQPPPFSSTPTFSWRQRRSWVHLFLLPFHNSEWEQFMAVSHQVEHSHCWSQAAAVTASNGFAIYFSGVGKCHILWQWRWR